MTLKRSEREIHFQSIRVQLGSRSVGEEETRVGVTVPSAYIIGT